MYGTTRTNRKMKVLCGRHYHNPIKKIYMYNNGELKSIFSSFKENIKCLIFTDNDLGATLWGENLLPQKGRERTQLTFFPHSLTKSSSFPSLWHLNKTLKLNVSLFYFFCFSLPSLDFLLLFMSIYFCFLS